MEATVIIAKCQVHNEIFAMRAQKISDHWSFTWAFKLTEDKAQREGYSTTDVSGNIQITHDYPGCPHCGARGFSQCGICNKLSCYETNVEDSTCYHCGTRLRKGSASDSFKGISGGAF